MFKTKTVMKIINQELDFRGWVTFEVQSKSTDQEIKQEFQELYPQNDIAVLCYANLVDTYEVTLIPKEKI
jgi:ribosomal protein L23